MRLRFRLVPFELVGRLVRGGSVAKCPSIALGAPVPLGPIDEFDFTFSGFGCNCQFRGSVLLVPLGVVLPSFVLCSVTASRLVVLFRLETIPDPVFFLFTVMT